MLVHTIQSHQYLLLGRALDLIICTMKIKIAFVILQIRKTQHGFKAMEGADSENSFHE